MKISIQTQNNQVSVDTEVVKAKALNSTASVLMRGARLLAKASEKIQVKKEQQIICLPAPINR